MCGTIINCNGIWASITTITTDEEHIKNLLYLILYSSQSVSIFVLLENVAYSYLDAAPPFKIEPLKVFGYAH